MKEEKKFINEYIDDVCVLGLSGGPDSMCLLSLLLELHKQVICVHINHNTRAACDDEYLFIKNYLEERHLPLEYFKIEEYNNGHFTEEEGRVFRYQKYFEVAKKYNAKYLLTAHHADDLTETIIMRILRGSSLSGYAGIKQISNWHNLMVLRPLLASKKSDIYNYLYDNHIPFLEDESNNNDDYLRNKIRHSIIPLFNSVDNSYNEKILKFSQTLITKDEVIKELLNEKMNEICVNKRINVLQFQKLSLNIQSSIVEVYLKRIYQSDLKEITSKHLNLFRDLVNGKKETNYYDFPKNYLFIKSDGWAYLKKKEIFPTYKIEVDDYNILPDGSVLTSLNDYSEKSNYEIHLNSNDIKLPLYVTNQKEGLKMAVKNLNGTKKISDILINSKINKEEKMKIPILIDSNNEVLWVLGIKKSKYDLEKNESYDIIYKYKKKEEEKNEKK